MGVGAGGGVEGTTGRVIGVDGAGGAGRGAATAGAEMRGGGADVGSRRLPFALPFALPRVLPFALTVLLAFDLAGDFAAAAVLEEGTARAVGRKEGARAGRDDMDGRECKRAGLATIGMAPTSIDSRTDGEKLQPYHGLMEARGGTVKGP
jgi:hypothetical protein